MATWPPENATVGLSPQDSIRWGSRTSPAWASNFTGFPRDANDLSILEPSDDSRIVYVDATLGNDGTAVTYTNIQAPDPYNYSPANPYLTHTAALAQMRDGFPDWCLFKKGETWVSTAARINLTAGRSATERHVIASYGSGVRPEITTGQNECFRMQGISYIAIQGIRLYPDERDPNSVTFAGYGNITDQRGIGLNATVQQNSIMVENCDISYYYQNFGGVGNLGYTDLVLRKNFLSWSWSDVERSQGAWSQFAEILVEDNIFDHNGWLIQQIIPGDDQAAQGQATIFNHNVYMTQARNSIFRRNILSRASSIGIKLTSNPPGPADSIESWNVAIYGNFIYAGEVGLSPLGNDDFGTGPRWDNIASDHNVMYGMGIEHPTNRVVGWGVDIRDLRNGSVNNNLMLQATGGSAITNESFLTVRGHTSFFTSTGNKLFGYITEPVADLYTIESADFGPDVNIDISTDMSTPPLTLDMDDYLTSRGFTDWPDFMATQKAAPAVENADTTFYYFANEYGLNE